MSAGFTPGPWFVERGVEDFEGEFYVCHGLTVCDATTVCNPHIEPDAHLIAAAPDLFEALESLIPGRLCGENWNLSDSEHVPIDITFGELRAARTALAKARGEA